MTKESLTMHPEVLMKGFEIPFNGRELVVYIPSGKKKKKKRLFFPEPNAEQCFACCFETPICRQPPVQLPGSEQSPETMDPPTVFGPRTIAARNFDLAVRRFRPNQAPGMSPEQC